MAECPNCHTQCEEGADFCTVCGTKLNNTNQQNLNSQDTVNLEQYAQQNNYTADYGQQDYTQQNYSQDYSQQDYTQQNYSQDYSQQDYTQQNYSQQDSQQQNFQQQNSQQNTQQENSRLVFYQAPSKPEPIWNPTTPKLKLPCERGLLKYILLSIITLGIYAIVVECRISGEINIAASRADGERTIHFLGMVWLSSITLGIYGLVWNHKFANRVRDELARRGYYYKFSAVDFWLWRVLGSLILVGPFVYCYKKLKAMNMINESYNIYG